MDIRVMGLVAVTVNATAFLLILWTAVGDVVSLVRAMNEELATHQTMRHYKAREFILLGQDIVDKLYGLMWSIGVTSIMLTISLGIAGGTGHPMLRYPSLLWIAIPPLVVAITSGVGLRQCKRWLTAMLAKLTPEATP